jgi:hypothetical protein
MGLTAFSCCSEKARIVPAFNAETTIQITANSSQIFFQNGTQLGGR